jgi:hypothetical protein
MLDLFTGHGCATNIRDDFRWSVAMFRAHGASEAIKRANQVPLRTYYPIKFNIYGDPIPLWRNYLFIEFKQSLTINICRSTSLFIKVLSMSDDEGVLHPILVRKEAIDENMRLLQLGRFNDKMFIRRFYGRGSVVRVTSGMFQDKKVRLENDVAPDMPGDRRVVVNINGLRGSIEIWKLAL